MAVLRSSFERNDDGGIALWAALVIPVILAMAGGAVDITDAQAERARFLNIAQGAALNGASDLSLAASASMATMRSKAWAESEIHDWTDAPAASVTSTVVQLANGQRAVRVAIAANRESIFGRILPPGGWHIDVDATAAPIGSTPLCVIATQTDHDHVINVKGNGAINGPGCLIHSDRDIIVEGSGSIDAGLIEAVGAVRGNINPDGVPDAPAISDPFQNIDLTAPFGINEGDIVYTTGVHLLHPGRHRQHITLSGDAVMQLEPGEHWFVHADLHVQGSARIEGDDVVLMFDKESHFDFTGSSMVRLTGRQSGSLSGFVLIATRDNNGDFRITSDHVDGLLGVVYAPAANLVIQGHAEVARQSAWTVIVAKSIRLDGNPTLFLNANYHGSDVPVPAGVGPRAGTRLVQ